MGALDTLKYTLIYVLSCSYFCHCLDCHSENSKTGKPGKKLIFLIIKYSAINIVQKARTANSPSLANTW